LNVCEADVCFVSGIFGRGVHFIFWKALSVICILLLLPGYSEAKTSIILSNSEGEVSITVDHETMARFLTVLHEKFGTTYILSKTEMHAELNEQVTAATVAEAVKKILSSFNYAMLETLDGTPSRIQVVGEGRDISSDPAQASIEDDVVPTPVADADVAEGSIEHNPELDSVEDEVVPTPPENIAKAREHFMMQQRMRHQGARPDHRKMGRRPVGTQRPGQVHLRH